MFNKLYNTIANICQVKIPNPKLQTVLGMMAATGVATLNATPLIASEWSFRDGVYLYGQSPTPETIGSEYLIFEVQDGSVEGAFYMPSSEFTCFAGTIEPQRLSLSVVDPYEDEVYPYAIALEARAPVAGTNASPAMGLEGFHRLNAPTSNDLRMLGVCQGNAQE
ncbi:MAG: hypothetical protein SVX43_00020 [Cyanobacteriota bacterium]|nr:hypothetical protein [Cyanobacteriota bacterium]